MFLDAPGNPTKLKKIMYLIAATILGLLLSFIAHTVIEMTYLSLMTEQGRRVVFYHGCALLPVISYTIWALGALGGFLLGRFWWRLVYIDRVWAKRIKKAE
jgi:hypothetical protein